VKIKREGLMRRIWTFTLAAVGFMALTAGAAHADPCDAPLPTRAGAEFGGVVRYVGDGDSLCVGPANGDGSTWIEVRLMDFNAPEMREGAPATAAKRALERIALGREAQCVVTRGRTGTRSFDRTHAVCRIDGSTIGELMREAGAPEGGN
jgi:hypothetical protein